jgi:hypothetical protein
MASVSGEVVSIRNTRQLTYATIKHSKGLQQVVLRPANLGEREFFHWKETVRTGHEVTVKGDRVLNAQKVLVVVASSWGRPEREPKASPEPPQRSTVLGSTTKGTNMNLSVADAIKAFGVDVDPHLEREFTIPVSAGLQRQGDVIVIPTPKKKLPAKATQVGAAGVPVVRGENGGNTHLLLAAGDVRFAVVESTTQGQLDVGVFTVAEDAQAYLAHPEHGYMGIAPGTYTVRRQREQADEIRQVAD